MTKSIVICKNYNRRKNVLFQMDHDDFRFNSEEFGYAEVSQVKSVVAKNKIADNGHKAFVVECENGKQYEVFVDWSARELGTMTHEEFFDNCATDIENSSLETEAATSNLKTEIYQAFKKGTKCPVKEDFGL